MYHCGGETVGMKHFPSDLLDCWLN